MMILEHLLRKHIVFSHNTGYDLATYPLHQSSQFCVVPIFELPRSSPLCLYFRPKCVNLPKSLRFYKLFSYFCKLYFHRKACEDLEMMEILSIFAVEIVSFASGN